MGSSAKLKEVLATIPTWPAGRGCSAPFADLIAEMRTSCELIIPAGDVGADPNSRNSEKFEKAHAAAKAATRPQTKAVGQAKAKAKAMGKAGNKRGAACLQEKQEDVAPMASVNDESGQKKSHEKKEKKHKTKRRKRIRRTKERSQRRIRRRKRIRVARRRRQG